ncbi:hemocyanin II-like [Bolinopsis microptera]|uniref:hemocyanin II-like n=1 Tax=Bolinopsis microptera TaxID=2820187 RepID=UPI003078AB06
MSCKCSSATRGSKKKLHKEILKVFLVDDEQSVLHEDQFENLQKILRDLDFSHIPKFNSFDTTHMMAAHETARKISKMPVKEMISTLSSLRKLYRSDQLVEYLTRVSLYKHSATTSLTLPPPRQTLPRLYFDCHILETGREAVCNNTRLDPEQRLSWWREDPGIAEHHYNWHVYYPYTEAPRDRQGELFAYMHEQMLARYDFERLAVGFGRVRAFGPGYTWEKPLKEGYNPRMEGFSFRPSGMLISETIRMESKLILTDVLQRNKERFFYSLARGYLERPDSAKVEITMDKLGNTMEANMGSVNKKLYGNLHNDGHNILSTINDPDGRYDVEPGPMIATQAAPRDTVFYRWHKFVDAIFEAYRVNLEPYSVNDLTMKDTEVNNIQIVTEKKPNQVNNLFTFMMEKKYTIYNPEKKVVQKKILNHIPFSYKLKVRNTSCRNSMVVFRIFLAPETEELLDQWRNMFIELDKFVAYLDPGEDREITRFDHQSSVILPPETTVQDILDDNTSPQQTCGCGWPRNLLIPRGNTAGMKANLLVLATNWEKDGVSPDQVLSGSVSYCGKMGYPYPDKKPMGFPFDRVTTFLDVRDLASKLPNSCIAGVTINFLEDYVGAGVEDMAEDSSYVLVSE